jgi:DNA polymerase-3 subunit alpha
MVEFAGHLHVHDSYSLLDGNADRNQLTTEAARKGQDFLGFTNHGVLGGALEHIHACRHPEQYEDPQNPGAKRAKDERLLPVLGIEAYWRHDRFMDLTDRALYGKNGHNWAQHLCLHAGNLAGWRTLLRLSAKSWVTREKGGGHYGKPCIDMAMLEQDHEGITVSTACINSPLAHLILAGDERGAKRWCKDIMELGIPLWFELMPHDLEEQRDYNNGIVNIAYDLSRPIVASGDVHTPYKKWMDTQSLVRMISYRQTLSDQEKKKDAGEDVYTEEIDSVYLSGGDEMLAMFQSYQSQLPLPVVRESLANTREFFQSFKPWQFGKSLKLPHVHVDAKSILWGWVQDGFERIKAEYPAEHWKAYPWEQYEQRCQEEWDVLVAKDVLDYFYIVADFIRWARSDKPLPVRVGKKLYYPEGKKRPIRCNLRGSAAGCLISYLIGISVVDPIPHELLFERFINPDREGMPDIDIDLESGEYGRDLGKEYFRIVYGRNHVADVIAYQTFGPRAVLKAVCDVHEVDFNRIRNATESIGDTERGLEKIAAKNPIVAGMKKDFPDAWEQCLRLEDQIKNDSRHASAIIVTDKPVTETGMAVQTSGDRETIITAWADRVEFPIVSNYGWQKFDLLGVNSLNKQALACELIERFYGEKVDLDKLPVMRDPRAVDPKVMAAFKAKKTWDNFQFAGDGITNALFGIAPDDINELSLANALYRPGASSQIDEYVARKRGEHKWTLWHESLKPFLGHTYGIIAFQEQVMQVCKAIGGFTGAQADFMRKAISKLYRLGKEEAQKEMRPYWEIWLPGCMALKIPRAVIDEVWALILEFGGYSFNKAHSTCYALQAYQDMWLKVYYPLAYYAAALTITKKQKKEDQAQFLKNGLREARSFGIEALPPDVNHSDVGWAIDGGKLRFGLASVNEMGSAAARAIVDGQPYKSFEDFVQRLPEGTNKTHHLALVKCGAFDALENREYLMGHAPMHEGNQIKFDIEMSCTDIVKKTVKLTDRQIENNPSLYNEAKIQAELQRKGKLQTATVKCRKHPEATIVQVSQRFDAYTVAEWMKDRPGRRPDEWEKATTGEIAAAERDSLNISMTSGSIGVRYYDFIADRIMTAEEVDALPRKPKRKKVKGKYYHTTWCTCEDCQAAEVVVGGEITRFKPIRNKRGDMMAFGDLVFGSDNYKLTFFTDAYRDFHRTVKSPTAFLISGVKNDRGEITVFEVVDVVELAKEQGWEPPPMQVNGEKRRRASLRLIRGGVANGDAKQRVA